MIMKKLEDHPSVRQHLAKLPPPGNARETALDAAWLRGLCLEAGADDVGFVAVDRPELDGQRHEIRELLPDAGLLISFVCRMNREPVRSAARSVANAEFYHVHDRIAHVGHEIVARLEELDIKAVNPPMGFPMEVARDGKQWVISHKPIAVAAGLGQMGIHRNVIHPKFGNFILLGTIVTDARISEESRPIDYNPCLECKLCVAACPVGAIELDGHFNFSACYTHNYREFSGGFTNWIETIADSKNAKAYRAKVEDAETASMWQSLSFGANYKAAYCMAVCPAGEDVIGAFWNNRKQFLEDIVKPLQNKKETIYVVPGSDAEQHVIRRFPHKRVKRVSNGLRTKSIRSFLRMLPLFFQRHQAKDLNATYHFTFTGLEEAKATVVIRQQTITVTAGHTGQADFELTADSGTWIRVLGKTEHPLPAMLLRKIRTKGPLKLLTAFRKCFPS